jgi:hypothetical protein
MKTGGQNEQLHSGSQETKFVDEKCIKKKLNILTVFYHFLHFLVHIFKHYFCIAAGILYRHSRQEMGV